MTKQAKIFWVKKHVSDEKSLKTGKMIFEFMTKQGIVSHLDISNVDIIYKFRLFVTIWRKMEKSCWPPVTLLTLHN